MVYESANVFPTPEGEQRTFGWRAAKAIALQARAAGFAGIVLMGLKFETAVGEAYEVWHDSSVTPLGSEEADLATGIRH